MKLNPIGTLAAMAVWLVLSGIGWAGFWPLGGGKQQPTAASGPFELTTSAFDNGADIPRRYTCEGDDLSVPLSWKNAPTGTRSFALIVDDPDAPDPLAPRMTFVHWVLYDIPLGITSLAEGARVLPPGTEEGINDFGRTGYGGPCPPVGRHRYFFKLYALDTVLPELSTPTKTDLVNAMEGHVLAKAILMGTYKKN